MNRMLALGSGRWLSAAALVAALLLTSCGPEKQQPEASDTPPAATVSLPPITPLEETSIPDWAAYISEHSASPVSRNASLKLRFVSDMVEEKLVGTSQPGLMTIEPAIDADVSFTSTREIELLPRQPLASGQRYTLTLHRNLLPSLPDRLPDYQFSVDVLSQSYALQIGELQMKGASDNAVTVKGTITTGDTAEADAVEQSLKASYEGEAISADWHHDQTGRNHSFTLNRLERDDDPTHLTLSWDGAGVGVTVKGEKTITIPAKDAFQMMRASAIRNGRDLDTIRIDFSERLDDKQNLDGLITLSSGDFTTRISSNSLSIFPSVKPSGIVGVTLHAGLKSESGRALTADANTSVRFPTAKPEVHFTGQGVILPDNDQLTIPFEAINAASVQVTAFRVYDNNIGQFLQVNTLSGTREMERVGRYLWTRRIPLGAVERDKWQRFAIDASDLFAQNPGGLFRLTIAINRGDALYDCSADQQAVTPPAVTTPASSDGPDESSNSGWDGIEDWYYDDSETSDRNNPCTDLYYRLSKTTQASNNFVAANIGLIAKNGSDNQWQVATTDIRNGTPLAGVSVAFYNFQGQEISRGQSNSDGMVTLTTATPPFYAVADKDKTRGYLKLSSGLALPTSHFDVGGETIKRGVKGTIYGERGVWRPGDTLHLTFVLQDPENAIPEGHPATLTLINPQGQAVYTLTNTTPVDDFYSFHVATSDNEITGDWRALVQLGGQEFSRMVKIETVMPNRLKLELTAANELLQKGQTSNFTLFSQWLHGASAGGLKAEVKVQMRPRATKFSRNTDFTFDDPTRQFSSEPMVLFDGELDDEGYAHFDAELSADNQPSGMLTAQFSSRVFEPSGAFSIASQSLPFHAYPAYVGIKLPKGDAARNMLLTDTAHTVEIASLSASGEPVSLSRVQASLYKIEWSWWWDNSGDSLANFAEGESSQLLSQQVIETSDGKGEWQFEVKYPDWGRYLIRVCDLDGGHCAAQIQYIDWPGWAGRAQEQRGAGASALTLYTDKKQYQVGETATINLPPASSGRALLSVENGSGILHQQWLTLDGSRTTFDLELTAAMAPNVYVSVTLLQPHQGKANDRPIRLFGVMPLLVEDPATRLQPQLQVADEVRPESTLAVDVSESNGKAMTYTLAVVDEGLLGLTNFKTPDLHQFFYQREALGVRTWDMFDEVVGAYGGAIERMLALGGSDSGDGDNSKKDRKRFPPVVRFIGPFTLAAGASAHHEIDLPAYIGAVRVMVVAGKQGAYGAAEQSVKVKQPLMVLTTLPRMVGPGEELRVPVSVFVLDDKLQDVSLSAKGDERLQVGKDGEQQLSFSRIGDQLAFFHVQVADAIGPATFTVTAKAGDQEVSQTIHIAVRPTEALQTRGETVQVAAGEQWTGQWQPFGIKDTNVTTLEVSTLAPLNLDGRLNYLVQYPHGCIEQTTSSVFPQLYLTSLLPAEDQWTARVQHNVEAGIARLKLFQQADGGFSYWPGNDVANPWGTTYAGHFLIEAERAGYAVPAAMMSDWKSYQKQQALTGNDRSDALSQSYRLYTLALAGSPEMGAMNRLRESGDKDPLARWLLAAAYQKVGLTDVATELVGNMGIPSRNYLYSDNSFGSPLRDKALVLEVAPQLAGAGDAAALAKDISAALSSGHWYSTQDLSWSLMALSHYLGTLQPANIHSVSYAVNGGAPQQQAVTSAISRIPLEALGDNAGTVTVSHDGNQPLFVTLSGQGIPATGSVSSASEGLSLTATFTDSDGNRVDVSSLKQGEDVVATVNVSNNTNHNLDNVALTQILPSGWELENQRLGDSESALKESKFDYRDYRDDRLNTYFRVPAGSTLTFQLRFTATYPGRYYLPAWVVEPMYDGTIYGRTGGQWVTVTESSKP